MNEKTYSHRLLELAGSITLLTCSAFLLILLFDTLVSTTIGPVPLSIFYAIIPMILVTIAIICSIVALILALWGLIRLYESEKEV